MNIIDVPIIALLLAMAMRHFMHTVSNPELMRSRKAIWMVAALLGLVLAILYMQRYLIAQGLIDSYWTNYFKHADPAFSKRTIIHVTLKEFFDERFFLATCALIGSCSRRLSRRLALDAVGRVGRNSPEGDVP